MIRVKQESFQLRQFYSGRTCIRTTKNSDANSKWIAQKLESLIMTDPNISYSSMWQVLLEKYGIESTSNMKLYEALIYVCKIYTFFICKNRT